MPCRSTDGHEGGRGAWGQRGAGLQHVPPSHRNCVSIAAQWISETCYRYSPTLNDENEEIADWLERLATNKRTVRGEWLSQYTFETIEEAQDQATEWLWTYNNE